MVALLLALLITVQGPPRLTAQGGTISGTLKMASGQPAAGVRVSAVLRGSTLDAVSDGALIGISQTDESGRFVLEDVPQGRYVIAAGRVDLLTYYPGTLDISKGKIVLITPGSIVNGIDFVLDAPSLRSEDPYDYRSRVADPAVTVQLTVAADGAAKVPVYANGKLTVLRLTARQGIATSEARLVDGVVYVPVPRGVTAEFKVSVENLPAGYSVKSLTNGNVDLLRDNLKLTSPLPASGGALLTTPVSIALTLRESPRPVLASGIRVSGKTPDAGVHVLLIAGTPGTFYSDGSFEFRGVPPGRQVILLLDEIQVFNVPRQSTVLAAATVVAGDHDIDDVVLEDIVLLPDNPPALLAPPVPSTRSTGAIPMATIRGTILDEEARKPVPGGTVTIWGSSGATYRVDSEGKFQIPHLFPGTYKLEIGTFAYSTVRETVVVADEDIALDFTSHRF